MLSRIPTPVQLFHEQFQTPLPVSFCLLYHSVLQDLFGNISYSFYFQDEPPGYYPMCSSGGCLKRLFDTVPLITRTDFLKHLLLLLHVEFGLMTETTVVTVRHTE